MSTVTSYSTPCVHVCRSHLPEYSVSANTGIRAADIGMPQLAMHSIREVMSCVDLTYAYQHFVTFFDKFADVDQMISKVDRPKA